MSILPEVSPHRYTVAEIERVESRTILRPPWTERRRAHEIAPAPVNGLGVSTGMLHAPDAWILKPHQGDLPRVVETEYAGSLGGVDATAGMGGAIGNVNVAPGVTVENRYADPSRFTGVPVDSSVTQPDWTIKRRPGPSGDFSEGRLAADEFAYPPLPTDTAHTPMDRIAVGRETVPPNQPWALVFFVPETNADNLLNFYFGGPTDTDVAGHPGGEFGANFRANGELVLWERDTQGSEWPTQPVFRFQTTAPGLGASTSYSYQLIPYYRDRLLILSAAAQTVLGSTAYAGAPYGGMGKPGRTRSLYREHRFASGHRHLTYMTGGGEIRVDRARQDRTPLRIIKLRYPATGQLVDLPFMIPYHVPDLQVLTVQVEAWVPAGGAVTIEIRNATTRLPLIADGVGRFLLTSGQKHYYAVLNFVRGTNNQTPVLFSYSVSLEGAYQNQVPDKIVLQCDHRTGVSITDGGTDPAQETAHFAVEDFYGEADALKRRGRFRTRIKTRYDPEDEDLYSTLFLGETDPNGVQQLPKMQEGIGMYTRYEVPCGPLWNRVADMVCVDATDFSKYPGAPDGSPAMKFTDILRHLFTMSGWLPDELDIDEAKLGDLRIIAGNPSSPQDDFKLFQGTRYALAIEQFAKQYLDAYVVYDPNAGYLELDGQPRGMWRVLPQPHAPYNPLCRFALGPDPGTTPAVPVHHPGAYTGDAGLATFILRDTYRITLRPPEANHVIAVGMGGVLADDQARVKYQAIISNPASFHVTPVHPLPDPDHPDYLGRCVWILAVDWFAMSQPAVAYLARRVYDRTCHATQRHHFRAPLVLVTDPLDLYQVRPRPLRAGDAVWIPADYTGGIKIGVVASVNKDIPNGDAGGHYADMEIVAINIEGEEEV